MKTKLIGTGTANVVAGAAGFGPGAMPASASPTVKTDVTTVPGAGNLLGNLLCAVAGLLDGPGNALGGIAAFSPAWASDPAERRLRRGGPTAGVAGAFPCTTGVPAMPCRHRPDVPTWRS